MAAALTVTDAQIVAVIVAAYGLAVAFVGKTISHLLAKNERLEEKVDRMHDDLAELNLEVRQLARAAFDALAGKIEKMADHDAPKP